ncbi:MAG TPA: M4 family metallopeptidase [Thermoanaerobaculia bacterium]|nr:M4 family metallopeptidase [Thermoanaerobaculia bacterium]
MRNIHPYVCGVIPRHMLQRLAEQTFDAEAQRRARLTLDQMHRLEAVPDRALLPATPETPSRRKRRNVYDARQQWQLPGKLVMSDHKRSTDVHAVEAWQGTGTTLDFFATNFKRHSIDNRGLRLDSTVHYGTGFQNAVWNGRQIVYGDGDGHLFNRFTSSIDITAHELMHGITDATASLGYSGESGALNEHISDAFGIMVRQYKLNQTANESDWLIGADLLAPGILGQGIRSMAAPGTAYDDPFLGRDPQPWHIRAYLHTTDDHGGVHINSGIPNHAFYLAATTIGGVTWDVVGRVWYMAVTQRLRSDDGFSDFARATVDLAGELYGNGGYIQRVIAGAWAAVGLEQPLFGVERLRIKSQPSPLPSGRRPKWRNRPVSSTTRRNSQH